MQNAHKFYNTDMSENDVIKDDKNKAGTNYNELQARTNM